MSNVTLHPLRILCGDALAKLRELPDESVQCCVTSPPYWGLRDYGNCECATKRYASAGFLAWDGAKRNGHSGPCPPNDARCIKAPDPNCPSCRGSGKINGVADFQLGLEKTPEEYVAKMVAVFREVRRVLRKDGTLWLNLGDSYSSFRDSKASPDTLRGDGNGTATTFSGNRNPESLRAAGLKHKDLIGIPWRVAFALQADGWWLRSDIIWAKPNPMPESVTDRPTKSHEYIFLLTKSARYFYDAEAIKERFADATIERVKNAFNNEGKTLAYVESGAYSRSAAIFNTEYATKINNGEATGCNKRSVWTVTTQPYAEAHFATFPPDLIKPCILAGSKAAATAASTEEATVLDPFAGSGTTGQVALELGRRAILIELNPKYVALIEQRTNITPGLALTTNEVAA